MSDEHSGETGMTLEQAMWYLDRIGPETDDHTAWVATADGTHYGIMVLSNRFFDLPDRKDLLGVYPTPVDCVVLLTTLSYPIDQDL